MTENERPPEIYELVADMSAALTCLLDDLEDAGEDQNEQGEYFHSIANAVEARNAYEDFTEGPEKGREEHQWSL